MKNRKRYSIENYRFIVAKDKPLDYASEMLQKAIVNLEYVNVDGSYKVIQFTSSLAGEGKTTMLANLAYILSQRGKKILVMDLDLRKPKIHRVFDVANEKGVNDFLLDKISLKEAVRHSKDFNVDFLISGEKTSAITNILVAQKLKDLIQSLKETYDYILVDSPPVLVVSDALNISNLVDGTIFVIAQNFAKRSEVKESIASLQKGKTPIIGSLLTQVSVNKRKDKYDYYNQYVD